MASALAGVMGPTVKLIIGISPLLSQVTVNILEAQKLVGVNINPAVFIRVGNQKRNTQTQKSTNCPFYNEVDHSPSQSEQGVAAKHSPTFVSSLTAELPL